MDLEQNSSPTHWTAIAAAVAAAFLLPATVGFAMALHCPHDACHAPAPRLQPAPATFRYVWTATYLALGFVGANIVLALADMKKNSSSQRAATVTAALALWTALIVAEALWVHTWGCECNPTTARNLLVAILATAVALTLALVAAHVQAHTICCAVVALHCAWLAFALALNQDVVDQINSK